MGRKKTTGGEGPKVVEKERSNRQTSKKIVAIRDCLTEGGERKEKRK